MIKRTRRYNPEYKRETVQLALTSLSVLSAVKDLSMLETTSHNFSSTQWRDSIRSKFTV